MHLAIPISHAGDMDNVDVHGTFTPEEARKLGTISVPPVNGVWNRVGKMLMGRHLFARTAGHVFRNNVLFAAPGYSPLVIYVHAERVLLEI